MQWMGTVKKKGSSELWELNTEGFNSAFFRLVRDDNLNVNADDTLFLLLFRRSLALKQRDAKKV